MGGLMRVAISVRGSFDNPPALLVPALLVLAASPRLPSWILFLLLVLFNCELGHVQCEMIEAQGKPPPPLLVSPVYIGAGCGGEGRGEGGLRLLGIR